MSEIVQTAGVQSPDQHPDPAQRAPIGPREVASRIGLALTCVYDVSALAEELAATAARCYANDGQPTMLAAEVLSRQVVRLANAICSALSELRASPTELAAFAYGPDPGERLTRALEAPGDVAQAIVDALQGHGGEE